MTTVAERFQAWSRADLRSQPGAFGLPALGFCDAINRELPELRRSVDVVVLSDGLSWVGDPSRLIGYAAAWGSAVIARDASHPACRWAALPAAMLFEAGGLNPALRAFFWLDDLERRLPAVSNMYEAMADDPRRADIEMERYAEALADLGTLHAPL